MVRDGPSTSSGFAPSRTCSGGFLAQEDLAEVDGDPPGEGLAELRGQGGYGLVVGEAVADGVERALEEQQEAVGLLDLAAVEAREQVSYQAVMASESLTRLVVAEGLEELDALDQLGLRQSPNLEAGRCCCRLSAGLEPGCDIFQVLRHGASPDGGYHRATGTLEATFLCLFVGSQDAVDPCLVAAALSPEPLQYVGVQAQGQLGLSLNRLQPLADQSLGEHFRRNLWDVREVDILVGHDLEPLVVSL